MNYEQLTENDFPTAATKESHAALYARAHAAGMAAGEASVPQPMTVVGGGKRYHVAEGLCGFAWIKVKPATSSFAKWLKATGKVRDKSYSGGYDIWVGEFNQSVARKEAYASAFAMVLHKAGINAYAQSRLD